MQFYLVFEEAEGGELFDRLARGRFTEADACRTIWVVLDAIAYMHHHNTVHRDIKPENILYRTHAEDSNIVLVDFGIAAHIRNYEGTDLHGFCGSVGYAAPEVIAKKHYGKQVDIWGLGVVTYTMYVYVLLPDAGFVVTLLFHQRTPSCSSSSLHGAKLNLTKSTGTRSALKQLTLSSAV